MKCRPEGDAIRYHSARIERPAEFHARYRPTGPVRLAAAGTLDRWLTDRLCLYTETQRTDILHASWPLQPAEAEIERNTMAAAAGMQLPDTPPLLHFARYLDVKVWRPEPF